MIQKTKAIVLKKFDFRETSIICTFYTPEFGKLKGILKGIRNDPKKFASRLEAFSLNEIIFYPTKTGELHLVSAADLMENFDNIRKDLDLIAAASYSVDLVDALMQVEDNNNEIFEILMSTLNELNNLNNNIEKVLAIFQIKALSSSGFKPHLESCVICSKQLGLVTRFSNALGGLLCSSCAHKDKQSRSIFRGTIATVLHIQRNSWEKLLNLGLHPQVKQELRIILSNFIEFHLERKLKTERVIHQLIALNKEVAHL